MNPEGPPGDGKSWRGRGKRQPSSANTDSPQVYAGRGRGFGGQMQQQNWRRGGRPITSLDDDPPPRAPGASGAGRGHGWQRNNENPQKRSYNLSYTRLDALSKDPSNNNVVLTLSNSDYNFETLVKDALREDLFFLVIKVLAKVCQSDFTENKIKIMTAACSSYKFMNHFPIQLNNLDERPTDQLKELIYNIIIFFESASEMLPYACFEALGSMKSTHFSMLGLSHTKNLGLETDGSLAKFETIINEVKTKTEEQKQPLKPRSEIWKERKLKEHDFAPPNDFREIQVYPKPEEVLCQEKPFLRVNLVDRTYADVDHYLDVQFRLTREDFMRPLRDGIDAMNSQDRKKMKEANVKMYEHIQFVRNNSRLIPQELTKKKKDRDDEGVLIYLNFEKNKQMKKVEWEHCRRFMYGSLLCFTKDKFQSLLLATIIDRDLDFLRKGFIRIQFCEPVAENIYMAEYTMIESEIFFDPYYHVLRTLQTLQKEDFPLAEYIVLYQKDVFPPRYLEVEPQVQYRFPNFRYPVNVLDAETWPQHEDLDLDISQYRALYMALTRELAVIQGPPGTGKTFIGLKIAQILVENRAVTSRKTPILVVCLTNHALDQFLVGISKFTSKIVRIGGQSKNEEISKFNLRLLRRHSKLHSARYANSKQEIAANKKQLNDIDLSLKEITKGIVSYEHLHKLGIAPAMFLNDAQFLIWLLCKQVEAKPSCIGALNFTLTLNELEFQLGELEDQRSRERDHKLLGSLNHKIRDAGVLIELVRNRLETTAPMSDKEAEQVKKRKMIEIPVDQRWQLYKQWLRVLENEFLQRISEFERDIAILEKQQGELQEVEDLEILRENEVVGMTTSGAARLHGLLRKLGTEIVIVEEAAEVMEPHVIACLTSSCKHLILIGDHKQLRPNIAVYQLAKDFNFDISLFERMVNRAPEECVTLEVQHRMAPEIAQLIVPAIYPKLLNDSSVKSYETVKGVCKRLYFIDHKNMEEMTDVDSHSRINKFEAEYALALCKHLVMQGYKASEITILATYRGQMFHIRKDKSKFPILDEVLVTVVDNYQGEENKIIILSLVRSNSEQRIGFLKMENRVNVAVSRARHGLFILGNMQCLAGPENGTIWKDFRKTLVSQNAMGHSLPLQCQNHPDKKFSISDPKDFAKLSPQGGCNQICLVPLQCGHQCQSVCHTLHQDHKNMKCTAPCEQLCDAVVHKCPKKCYEECGTCQVIVTRKLPCGHEASFPCHADTDGYKCQIKMKKLFSLCGHFNTVKCCQDPLRTPCPEKCDRRLDCGHRCEDNCHVKHDPDHLKYQCSKTCNQVNPNCASGDHRCGKKCHEDCEPCNVMVVKLRKCGHEIKVLCQSDPDSHGICHKKSCERTLKCGHKCSKPCMENCDPCMTEVNVKHPICGHEITKRCGTSFADIICKEKCGKLMTCGHVCEDVCGRQCDTSRCSKGVAEVVAECGHYVDLYCSEYRDGTRQPRDNLRCKNPCGAELACSHPCPGTCGTCYQGRFHVLCDKPCGRNLICNHTCKEMCAESCPPCHEKCTFRCEHSKCPKKCGEPCVSCKERCSIGCVHRKCKRICGDKCDVDPCNEPCTKRLKCDHECVGLCGEPCPPLCRICDKEELTEILFGDEDEPNARFVYLPECKHCIEVKAMDKFMKLSKADEQQEGGEIGVNVCPKCKSKVTAVRYNNIIKANLENVNKVKEKYFGDRASNDKKRNLLVERTTDILSTHITLEDDFLELHFCLTDLLNSLMPEVAGRKNVLHAYNLNAREIEVDILTGICKTWGKCKSPIEKEGITNQINFLLQIFESKKRRVGQQQVDDFLPELTRLEYMRVFLSFKDKVTFYKEIEPLIREGMAVDKNSKFTKSSEAKMKNVRDKLANVCKNIPGLGITEIERVQIVQAIGLTPGHWFSCPKGHVYAIGECGGAMERSKCPECGSTIGGGNHALDAGNRHFGGMDRSRHAAWSDQANMENYNFD
ncbi:NFX1-type zinc finger-containing protein 1-like [Neocloeon triangulifer]|uniref:NFX1-type zinc finger-containing protein 1-like n=1 Tax=Neocloeon triangulifer TaxID=2078957 RepID=UPI00286EE553|nr:NFX1-type zinc finger-containing protein 1-like [Neocloeon triangulifer]